MVWGKVESVLNANQSPVYICTRDFVLVWSERVERVFVDSLESRVGSINTAPRRSFNFIFAFDIPPQPYTSSFAPYSTCLEKSVANQNLAKLQAVTLQPNPNLVPQKLGSSFQSAVSIVF